MNAQSCSVTLHISSTCYIDQYTNKLVCFMMGVEQEARALLWARRELVLHAKNGRPHQGILSHSVCSTIYHTSVITPSALYPPAHLRAIMHHLTPLSSVNYEPFQKLLLHCGSLFCCSLSCSKPCMDEIQKPVTVPKQEKQHWLLGQLLNWSLVTVVLTDKELF